MKALIATALFLFFCSTIVSAQVAPVLKIKKDSTSYTQKEVRDFLLSGTPLARSAQETLLETINNVLKANGFKLKEDLDSRYIEWILLGHTEIQKNLEIFNFLNSGRSPDSSKVVFNKKTTPYYKGPVFVFVYKHIAYRYAKGVCFNQIRGAQEKQVSVDQEVGELRVVASGSSEPFKLDTLMKAKKEKNDGAYSKRDLERALEDTLKARDKRALELAKKQKKEEERRQFVADSSKKAFDEAVFRAVDQRLGPQQKEEDKRGRRNTPREEVVYVDQYGQPTNQRTTIVSLSLGGQGYRSGGYYGGGYGQYQTYPAQYGRGYDCVPANVGGYPTSGAFNAAANWSQQQRPWWCR